MAKATKAAKKAEPKKKSDKKISDFKLLDVNSGKGFIVVVFMRKGEDQTYCLGTEADQLEFVEALSGGMIEGVKGWFVPEKKSK